MSKQHHFTVWYDTETKEWEIGHARYDEDAPLYDTDTEEWSILDGEDSILDGRIWNDLTKRLK